MLLEKDIKEVGLDVVSVERPKCMFLSRYQKTGQNHCTKVANKFFENVAKFKY
jgi:hypothetical protein